MVLITLFLVLLPTSNLAVQDTPSIPDAERRALDAIYEQAGGDQWTERAGWGGQRGTECDWHGITCKPDGDGAHVVWLQLNENNLRGLIPDAADALSHLRHVWLWENKLTRIPNAWRRREDLGELDLRVWSNPLEHRITEISLETAQGDLLCAHSLVKLSEDGAIMQAAIRCRNRTSDDRSTYCEVSKASVGYILFQRLARLIENSGFYDLKRSYTVNQTHAGSQILRVTRDGRQRTIDNYGYMEPLQLFGIELAIQGAVPSEWETATQHPEAYCRQIFRDGNDAIHAGGTYLLELPPDIQAGEPKYLPPESGGLPVRREIFKDSLGTLMTVESWVTKVVPAIVPTYRSLRSLSAIGRRLNIGPSKISGILARFSFQYASLPVSSASSTAVFPKNALQKQIKSSKLST